MCKTQRHGPHDTMYLNLQLTYTVSYRIAQFAPERNREFVRLGHWMVSEGSVLKT